jgi:hypothetical protein
LRGSICAIDLQRPVLDHVTCADLSALIRYVDRHALLRRGGNLCSNRCCSRSISRVRPAQRRRRSRPGCSGTIQRPGCDSALRKHARTSAEGQKVFPIGRAPNGGQRTPLVIR